LQAARLESLLLLLLLLLLLVVVFAGASFRCFLICWLASFRCFFFLFSPLSWS
jgi:hypothetical protein